MILDYMLRKNRLSKYENTNGNVKSDNINILKQCFENVSITLISFGSIIIAINLFISQFFLGNIEILNFYKLFSATSGIWITIVALQIIAQLFSSNFFESSTHLFINSEKDNDEIDWNFFDSGLFLANILSFSCVSIISFYGIFSYIINPVNVAKEGFLSMASFSFSMNLMFLTSQFLYVLLKIHKIRRVNFSMYNPFFLPGFACLLESMKTNIQSKIRDNLLNSQIEKYKYKQKIKSHNMYEEENMWLVN
ncbi:conserved Plasmodium protein, unknown function [Plasmodium vinckei]|uniref:Transmembrane protein n=1 Tax=Plasmodium vinckei TaxID=5860 RepID=A0A6V7T8A8_PLAVN|nr:conserved Plasmodium protein, unknown function [Plasmodium vinckei]